MAFPQCSSPFSAERFKLNSPMKPKESWTLSDTMEPKMLDATQ